MGYTLCGSPHCERLVMRLASLAVKPHVTYTQKITFRSPFPPLPVMTLCKQVDMSDALPSPPTQVDKKVSRARFLQCDQQRQYRVHQAISKLSPQHHRRPVLLYAVHPCSPALVLLPPFPTDPHWQRRVLSHLFHLPVVQPLLVKDDTTVKQSCQFWPLFNHVWLRMRLAPLHLQHLPASLSTNNMPFMRSLTLEKMHMNPHTASKGTTV